MESKKNLLNHFISLKNASNCLDVKISLDCDTFMATATLGNTKATLFPSFITFRDDTKQYIDELDNDVTLFSGWRPYHSVNLPTFSDPLTLKQHLNEVKILTPRHSTDNIKKLKNVIVKNRTSSFSQGIHGPFRCSTDFNLDNRNLYFEEFKLGEIVKIWFWNSSPLCYEIQNMPTVKGDGKKSIKEILELRTFITSRSINNRQLFEVLDYFDTDMNTILPNNQKQIVDFRYASPLARRKAIDEVIYDRSTNHSDPLKLQHIADSLWPIICDEHGDNLLYTVDAILDENHQLWILEANSHPMVHPCAYPMMLNSLFETASATELR